MFKNLHFIYIPMDTNARGQKELLVNLNQKTVSQTLGGYQAQQVQQ